MTIDELQTRGFDRSTRSGEHNRVKCSQCVAAVINGVPCHETGCPNTPHKCPECGQLYPTRQDAAECCVAVVDDYDDDIDPDNYEDRND